ncbi:MAG: VOC family protein [Xenococcaceae cyanobacterium MO_188.B32]|nr:VOC family protein [Xenococcaceae cyanobacterium MO_188.B32]
MTFKYTKAFITIASPKISILVEFYSKLLQQKPQPYIPNSYAEFDLLGLRLGIFQPQKESLVEFVNSQNTTMSICLEVENLAAALAHLNSIGYPPPGEIISASHGREIYAYDPLGNRLILHQSKKQ